MADPAPFIVAVVDDDAAIRRLVGMLLRRSGYEFFECTTAEEAREMLNARPWDLAILDRRLPDLDGAILCHELRNDHSMRSRYIIMLTGEADQEDKVAALDLGADDYITKPFQHGELLARIRAGKRIVDLQKELIETNKRLELLSITDGLTSLYNHRYFQDELSRKFEEADRYQRPLSLALLDIDFFKKINDTWGHAIGDEVLRSVARVFKESIRSADLAARYGGEEFAVMMPETERDDAILFAEKIRTIIASSAVDTTAGEVPVTVSIGVATFPATRLRSARALVEAADKALYRAKRNGRNQVQAERRKDTTRKRSASGETPAVPAAAAGAEGG